MSKLSRRTMVAGTAALPALAVPAVASFSPDHPDAELLRLGVQLETIGRDHEALTAVDHKRSDEWEAICERAGLPNVKYSDWSGSKDEYAAYHEKRSALMPHYTDEEEDENGKMNWDRLCDRLDPLVDEILGLRATTVAGLKVQARAVGLAVPWIFQEEDGGSNAEMDFIRAVFTFLDVDERGKCDAA
jgi:hypothetical protein